MRQIYNAERSWKKAGVNPSDSSPVPFIDENIKRNELGEHWGLALHQRAVFEVMYSRPASIRLWSEIKKSGKTFLAACVAIKEAVTRPDAEVICVANDLEQAESRVYATVTALCAKNPELRASVVKVTKTEISFSNGSTIKAIASDYRGAAGGRQVLTILDELWAFDLERMTRLFEELRPAPTTRGSYILIVSYAGFDGESTVLQALYRRGLSGKRISKRYELYQDGGLVMFWSHVGRQPWHTKAYFAEERKTLRENQFRRLHRNEWVSNETQFITGEQWDLCIDPDHAPVMSRTAVHLGLDIGTKSDASAIAAVCFHASGKLMTAFHKIWKPTRGNPVRLDEVKSYVKEMYKRHMVKSISADPSQAYLLIQQLRTESHIDVTEFAQTQDSGVKMGETLFSLVKDRNLIAYPSPELREHIVNAVGIETPKGVRMVKGKQSKKIDAAIALAMALCGALEGGRPVSNPNALPLGVGRGIGADLRQTFGSTLAQPFPNSTFGPTAPEERPGKGGAWLYGFNFFEKE